MATVAVHATSHHHPLLLATTEIPAASSIKGIPSPSAAYMRSTPEKLPLNGVNSDGASHGANMTTPSAAQGRVQAPIRKAKTTESAVFRAAGR